MKTNNATIKLNNDKSESKKKKITSLMCKLQWTKKKNITERNESVEDIMNISEEIEDQISNTIDDINNSKQEDPELNER